jgi:hypothetical protein
LINVVVFQLFCGVYHHLNGFHKLTAHARKPSFSDDITSACSGGHAQYHFSLLSSCKILKNSCILGIGGWLVVDIMHSENGTQDHWPR